MANASKEKPGLRTLSLHSDVALVRNVVENAFVPTFLADADGHLAYANRAFAELLGYRPEELVGFGFKEIVHPDDAPAARAQMTDLLARKIDGYRAERRYLRKNGDPIWVLASAAALIDEKTGAMRHLTVQAIDIDGQKRAEAELIQSETAGTRPWKRRARVCGSTTISTRRPSTRACGASCAASHLM